MKGDYVKAGEMFEQAALKAKNLSLEARSQYNLGNCAFRESERQRDSDLQKSLKALEKSISHYQKAVRLDPTLKDAAHNIEIARLTMKQILDEIKKKQEQAKKQMEEQQKHADKLKELIEKQERLAKDTKALQDEKKEKGDSGDLQKDSQVLAESQKDLKNQTEKLTEQMKPPQNKPNPSVEKSKGHLQRAISEQDKAEKKLEEQDLQNAHTAQEKAAEEMKKALGEAGGQGGDSPEQKEQGGQEKQNEGQENRAGQESKPEQQGAEEQQQAAVQRDERVHDILDEERENRERRQLGVDGGYRAVDKDW